MKQKKIGSDLYVFDTSAYQITKDTDAENIYIQQELIPAYEKLNSSTGVQAKIKPINYKLNIIQKPVWGDYIYAEEEVTEPEVKFGIGLNALIEHADQITDFYKDGDTIQLETYTYYMCGISVNGVLSNSENFVIQPADDTLITEMQTSGSDIIFETGPVNGNEMKETTLNISWNTFEDTETGIEVPYGSMTLNVQVFGVTS